MTRLLRRRIVSVTHANEEVQGSVKKEGYLAHGSFLNWLVQTDLVNGAGSMTTDDGNRPAIATRVAVTIDDGLLFKKSQPFGLNCTVASCRCPNYFP